MKEDRQHIRKQAWALWKCHRSKWEAFRKKHKLIALDTHLGKESFNNDGEIIEFSVCMDEKLIHWTTDGIDAKKSEHVYVEIKSKKVTRKNKNLRLDFHITFTGRSALQRKNLIAKLSDPTKIYWLFVRVTHLGEIVIDAQVLIKDTQILQGLKRGITDFILQHYVGGKSFKVVRFNEKLFQRFSTPTYEKLLGPAIKKYKRRKK